MPRHFGFAVKINSRPRPATKLSCLRARESFGQAASGTAPQSGYLADAKSSITSHPRVRRPQPARNISEAHIVGKPFAPGELSAKAQSRCCVVLRSAHRHVHISGAGYLAPANSDPLVHCFDDISPIVLNVVRRRITDWLPKLAQDSPAL